METTTPTKADAQAELEAAIIEFEDAQASFDQVLRAEEALRVSRREHDQRVQRALTRRMQALDMLRAVILGKDIDA